MIRILLFSFLFCIPLHAQSIIHAPDSEADFPRRWQWAKQEGEKDTYWVGYRIEKLMSRRSYYSSYWKGRVELNQSLYALIGEPGRFDESLTQVRTQWNYNGQGTIHFNQEDNRSQEELILKEIAVLIKLEDGEAIDVIASNMSLQIDLEGFPLYWLDRALKTESIAHLTEVYGRVQDTDLQEDLISVIGFHGQYKEVEGFLDVVLTTNQHADIRGRAVYALGKQDTEFALQSIKRVIRDDSSLDVREDAIYSLTQMSIAGAQDYLIDMARNQPVESLRKKAIYALGQKASRKALETLEDTIYDEKSAEIQKHAIHALAEFDPEVSVPRLIEVANNHQSVEVRKRAIYVLGDIGNDQAVEALIDLVEGL